MPFANAANTMTVDCLTPPIIVTVGHPLSVDTRTFHVHRNVLNRHSPILSNLCSDPGTNVIALENHDPDLFNVYLQWLYTTHLIVERKVAILDPQLVLARCFVTGEKLRDVEFRNAVLATIIDETQALPMGSVQRCPALETVGVIYDGTQPGSPARRLMVDLYLLYGQNNFRERLELRGVHRDFLEDLTWAFLRRERDGDQGVIDAFSLCEKQTYRCERTPTPVVGKRKRDNTPIEGEDLYGVSVEREIEQKYFSADKFEEDLYDASVQAELPEQEDFAADEFGEDDVVESIEAAKKGSKETEREASLAYEPPTAFYDRCIPLETARNESIAYIPTSPVYGCWTPLESEREESAKYVPTSPTYGPGAVAERKESVEYWPMSPVYGPGALLAREESVEYWPMSPVY